MKTLKILAILLPLLVYWFSSNAQTSKNDVRSSKTTKIDTKILQQKIDSLFSKVVNENQAGGVIGVLSGNDVWVKKAYGLKNVEEKTSIDENTPFNIASVAKHFTAYAILLLEKNGKLKLDDDIRKYLPQLPSYKEKISIRNLIQHTSGIASTDVLRLFGGLSFDEPWNQKKEIELILSYPQLNFSPNTQHMYSNAGYSLLAEIVEVTSKMKFSEFVKTNIFNPLSMNSSFVYDSPETDIQHCAAGHKKEKDVLISLSTDKDYTCGSGNIYTNLNDMIKWGKNIFSSKNESKDYYDKIIHPYNTFVNGDTIQYTYGFNVKKYKGVKLVEHSGGILGFRNQFMIFPDEQLMIIVMLNNESINSLRLAYKIVDLILADKLIEEVPKQRVAISIENSELKPFEGNYQMPDGMELNFTTKQDTFWLEIPGEEKFQLFPESKTKFFLKAFNAQCTFLKSEDGNVCEMIWHQGGKDSKAVKTVEKKPLELVELDTFTGKFFHEILKAEYRIELMDGVLVLYPPKTFKTYLGFEIVKLSHINGDKFATDNFGILEFTRNSEKQINGFVLLDVGRLQNIIFSKL